MIFHITYKAEELGYHPEVILLGRRINDSMGKYIAENTVKMLIKVDRQIRGSRVLILGFTFKENVPDTRNTKVVDIIRELWEYGIEVHVTDPVADKNEAFKEYGLEIEELEDLSGFDAVILAVNHKAYKELDLEELKNRYRNGSFVLVDVKGMFEKEDAENAGYLYWRL